MNRQVFRIEVSDRLSGRTDLAAGSPELNELATEHDRMACLLLVRVCLLLLLNLAEELAKAVACP
ncbi:MAG: hypothetical protein HGA63_12010 [Syntrophobacteraceae bacterium]|nr:hypothetical protein [Syntrophobacteraceae bacterium]